MQRRCGKRMRRTGEVKWRENHFDKVWKNKGESGVKKQHSRLEGEVQIEVLFCRFGGR